MVDTYVSDAYALRVCGFKSHLEHQKNLSLLEIGDFLYLFLKIHILRYMQSLFSRDITPLASLLRPEKLDDLVGQSHLIGVGKPIRKFIEAGRLPSILLW